MDNNKTTLMTKFYYKDNHLYFQILIRKGTDTQMYNEFTDYSEYKRIFGELQKQIAETGSVLPAEANDNSNESQLRVA